MTDSKTGQTIFLGAFKKALNKKIFSNISPMLEGNIYVTNFRKKANIFDISFANQYNIHPNGSELPKIRSKTRHTIIEVWSH